MGPNGQDLKGIATFKLEPQVGLLALHNNERKVHKMTTTRCVTLMFWFLDYQQ